MNKTLKRIIICIIISIVVIGITLPFQIVMENDVLVEVMLVLTGAIELLACNIRETKREKNNLKKYGRRETYITDDGYDSFQNVKYTLIISGIFNLLVSLIWHFITKI